MEQPTMAVSESNGEVSASVDETNRVREQLGLKPLSASAASSKEAEARAHGEELAKAEAKERDEETLRAKFEDAKRKRLLHQKLHGSSLGEMLEGEEMDSAMAWIEKSRRQEETRKERRKEGKVRKAKPASTAQTQSQRYDEMDEEVSHIAGALVGHSADDFKAGESVVLTLADERVLVEDGNSYHINDKEEMLENVNMAEDWRRQHGKEMATGGKYNPYGDNKSILSKYDEDGGRATVTLDESGTLDEAKAKKLAAIKQKLLAASGGGAATSYDLSISATAAIPEFTLGDDYQTMEEAAAFKKSNGKAKKLRKKQRDSLDLEALSRENAEQGDHGSHQERIARANERESAQEEAKESKRQRFDRALAMAEDKALHKLTSDPMQEGEAEPAEEAEVDSDLYAALARARRLAAMKAETRSEDYAAQRVARQLEAAEQWRSEHEQSAGVELSSLEFSETGEFCKAVRVKDDAGESHDLPSAQYKQMKSGDKKVKVEAAPASGEEHEEQEEMGATAKVKHEHDLLHERPAGSGLGAVLDIVRNRGLLGTEAESSGRMFDQKGAGLHNYDDDDEKETSFQLNYHDEYGRKMTQKQAFRQLSWKFHGKGPSKKNREKRMLEVEKQMAARTEDRAMEYMTALQQAQQSTKSAHVVLSGVNAIKPTDVARMKQAADRSKLTKKKKGEGGSGFESSIPGRSGFESNIPGRSGFESNIPGQGGGFIP
ncbi:hypothetical protein AB1Y20_023684 [Prymnesium parvum]|uniref:SART-1 family protein n=1 Tax=Prymnesium parvum TaxID=97485 RepID=A0AB34JEE4_PRYPA